MPQVASLWPGVSRSGATSWRLTAGSRGLRPSSFPFSRDPDLGAARVPRCGRPHDLIARRPAGLRDRLVTSFPWSRGPVIRDYLLRWVRDHDLRPFAEYRPPGAGCAMRPDRRPSPRRRGGAIRLHPKMTCWRRSVRPSTKAAPALTVRTYSARRCAACEAPLLAPATRSADLTGHRTAVIGPAKAARAAIL